MWARNAIQKTWMKADEPIVKTYNTTRHESITLYGAVANFTSDIIINRDKTTDTDGYIDFLEMIMQYHDERYMKGQIYLVLDNHSVHKAILVRKHYEDRFALLFLPAYSSYLSGVERLWAILKRELGQHIDRIGYEMTMSQFRGEVDYMGAKVAHE